MIIIRYEDLPEGLHAQARADGRRTIIYLRRGLTPEQRRLSLRRARQSARMGYGPRLSAAGVALAVASDTTRGTLRNLTAAARIHPVTAALFTAALGMLLAAYPLLVTGSGRIGGRQQPGGSPAQKTTGRVTGHPGPGHRAGDAGRPPWPPRPPVTPRRATVRVVVSARDAEARP
jgi:hypothetical protein